MIITMVIDQYGTENNGTTISTRRFASALEKRGHTVRIVSAGGGGYNTGERYVPLATEFARPQGILFAKADEDILTKAIEGSDVVHLLMPFKLECTALKIARRLGVAVTGAFHVQAENVTSQLGLKNSDLANKAVYKLFRKKFYRHLKHIHCPSEMIANELLSAGYNAKMYVTSNGADSVFTRVPSQKPPEFKDKIVLLTIGRLSSEKRHDVLIDAIKLSRFADRIQLIIAGKGPLLKRLMSQAEGLANPPLFTFYTRDELIKVINYADLYVHPADIEIEAIACVEAFKCGLVPVISNSEKCATKQFALTEQNIFECNDAVSLAEKIDFWLTRPELLRETSERYLEYGKQFETSACIVKIEQMFEDAIRENVYNEQESD